MIETSKILILIAPILCSDTEIETTQSKYAKHIPYNELYLIEEVPNKDTMNYNTMSMEELVKKQNEEIMIKIMKESNDTKGF